MEIGLAHFEAGRLAEAESVGRQVLMRQPDRAEALYLLALIASRVGKNDTGLRLVSRAIAINPKAEGYFNLLGILCEALGKSGQAIDAYRASLGLKPDFAEAYHNLGNVFQDQGRLEDAIAAYEAAVVYSPIFIPSRYSLANVFLMAGKREEAVATCRAVLRLNPDFVDAYIVLGNAQWEIGRFDEAIAAYREAIRLTPDSAVAYNNLGGALVEKNELDAAVDAFQTALRLKPDYAGAHSNLGNALKDQGLPEKAIQCYRAAVNLSPGSASLHSNLIYALYFRPLFDARGIQAEQARWSERHAAPLRTGIRPHGNERTPSRRLKVGYVSPDFSTHPVFFFILPLLEAHDRREVEVFCYSCTPRPDAGTTCIRSATDVWREVLLLDDARLAEVIREDGIDILVDLAMHSANNRLPAFGCKPAPIQVSWLAYPGSTGLAEIDYHFTDAWMDPPGSEAAGSERAVRLSDSWCCYRPVADFPDVTPLPALQAGHVTFGSFQNVGKVNETVLRCWARVLTMVPGARLSMACPEGTSRERVRGIFAGCGVAAERVSFAARRPLAAHLRDYGQIDIGLDPFPCNGMTTTCHALWMGVPVVTLTGQAPIARAGLSLLSVIGLEELAADSEDSYVGIAAGLAKDLPRLASLRGSLRERMRASPLMDAPRFARNVEHAYRAMWRKWCEALQP